MPKVGGAMVGMCVGGWTPYLLMQRNILKNVPQGRANALVTGGVVGGAVIGYLFMAAAGPKEQKK